MFGRCNDETCKKKAGLGFDCAYCKNNFCAEHRMPEDHTCKDLQQKLAEKLEEDKKKAVYLKCKHSKLIQVC
jgi:predicted nucleic acid binding AN1-type Zn finger protein